ncbi:Putrescine transport system permease protein PotH [Roseivivax jejudonensis]|uniref:Putrescine transport system permease protein PotH n=1 Tax=Roseivivax jejudonensis TaxID=1529041 RepID=A0A1X7A4R4_9RHOB|nr:ABC transporter permease [Roseivivax jejudonensis]SLN70732.1 Putrescine transport system permease protein PotH [Roseivivax jejudonensis]
MTNTRRAGLMLVAPATLFIAIGFLLPVFVLLSGAFRLESGWTLSNFTDFFADPLYREVFFRTFRLGLTVTAVAALLGYATALAINDANPRSKGRLVALLVLPLMISPVARTYAWLVILGRTGFLNVALTSVGLTDEPLRILFTEWAVFIGLLQLFFPLMVLPLISSLENMPRDVIPAARVLGASWLAIFWRIILPLTREGLVVGGTLTFVGSLTAYVTPAILGGSKVLMLETLLYQRVSVANDYASAGVIAVILIAMSVATNVMLKRLATARGGR